MHRLRRTVFGACRRSQLRRGQRQIRAAFRGPIGGLGVDRALRDAFGSYSPNSVFRSQALERALVEGAKLATVNVKPGDGPRSYEARVANDGAVQADTYGHGSHVAGMAAGRFPRGDGRRRRAAPPCHLAFARTARAGP